MKNTYMQLPLLATVTACSFFIIVSLNEVLLPGTVVFLRMLLTLITVGVILLFIPRKCSWSELPWGWLLFYGILQFLLPWSFITFALGGAVKVQWIVLFYSLFLFAALCLTVSYFKYWGDKEKRNRFYYFFIAIIVGTGMLQYIMDIGIELWLVLLAATSIGAANILYQQELRSLQAYPQVAFCSLLWATPFAFILMMEASPGTIKYIFQPNILIEMFFLGVIVSGSGVIFHGLLVNQNKEQVWSHGFGFILVWLFTLILSMFQSIPSISLIGLGGLSVVALRVMFMYERMVKVTK